MTRSFEKTFGDFVVEVSEGWPRRVTIKRKAYDTRDRVWMELEEARDVHHALGRLIRLADADDERLDRLSKGGS